MRKETKRIYYFVLFPAFLIAFCIGLYNKNYVLASVAIGLFIFFMFLLTVIVHKAMVKANLYFINDLDIRKFLDFYERTERKGLDNNSLLLVNTNLMTGYLACGELGKAFDVYYITPYSQALSKKAEPLMAYLLVYTECLLTGGYLDNIEKYFCELDELLGKVNPKNIQHFKTSMDLLRFQYLCQIGNYDELEELYVDLNERADSLYRRVKLNYWCGVYYNKTGKYEEAVSKFKFVAENGKETIFAKKAKEFVKVS